MSGSHLDAFHSLTSSLSGRYALDREIGAGGMATVVLFSAKYETHPFHQNYDIAPDGKHFVMIKPGQAKSQVIVVVNWLEEFRRRLGATP